MRCLLVRSSIVFAPFSSVPSLAAVFLVLAPVVAHAGPNAGLAVLRLAPDERVQGTSGRLTSWIAMPDEALSGTVLEHAPGADYRWIALTGAARSTEPAPLDRGLSAPSEAGTWALEVRYGGQFVRVENAVAFVKVSLANKRGGYLNGYHIGRYAHEDGRRTGRYAAPEGFIEVTPENASMPLSEHFKLADFVTHDQRDRWPKYVVTDLRLIDKLERVILELRSAGISVSTLHLMSGYRTPQYNGPGGKGRVKNSRHTYGDAADVWVDEDHDGRMDDLNRDGRVDAADGEVILAAVDRIERRTPALMGGVGLYRANREHGPFVHIDARGTLARWANR